MVELPALVVVADPIDLDRGEGLVGLVVGDTSVVSLATASATCCWLTVV